LTAKTSPTQLQKHDLTGLWSPLYVKKSSFVALREESVISGSSIRKAIDDALSCVCGFLLRR